ncbi:aldehyde:ferredoxin oxidoreductase [Desulfocucumis palustris]|uniref:Aldehyde:ferredoxin oxidoreductase n=1 Tax=Desulfocucumis palustris TaxID=1898651 RepID=A0A2L2XGM0_9FIRM|nr:aldehyde ferredoxin oxidoreductase family protein [Desulfocucumis palustris]GBF35292.1 aldehyde:ferredoxin oxidoreductase [Desulfocucumis palustris]
MKGFFGKLLRINLTDKSYAVEGIPESILKKYLGGKGLGSYLLLNNVSAGVDPLSSDNKLIFTTGPATGTLVPGSSRYGLYAKSPQTGLYAESYAGGRVAPAIRATGYDAIIIEGAASSPAYLEINDKEVLFHDAGQLWGTQTYAAEDALLAAAGRKDAQAVVIGPAGEKLVAFACVENNYWRSAGRTGMGAVMGSKKLKGIVFYGDAKSQAADPELLKEAVGRIREKAKDNPGVKAYQTYGTPVMVGTMNAAKAFPTRYWSDGSYDRWQEINGDAHQQRFKVKARSCPSCFLACAKDTVVTEGEYKDLRIEGPEYETIYSFGGLCCIHRLDEILYLNDICDRLGMDTITAGNLAGLVIEAGKGGRLDYKLEYGDAGGVARLLEDMALRRGIGEELARGIKYFSEKYGLQDIAVHVKGLEPPGYDPRKLKGMGLAFATSTRGACHLRATFYKPELAGMIDPSTTDGKAELFIQFENRLTIFNTFILCVFFRDLYQWEDLIPLIKALTGWEYTRQELEEVANNIVTLTRQFNAREGATKQQDTLPPKLFNEPINEGRNIITREELQILVDDYYRLRGWDDQGYPMA